MFASASLSLLASLASAQFPPVPPAPPAVVPTVRVTVDSSARTVTISAGPYEVPGMPMPDHHADDMPMMMMDGHAGVGEPLLDFTWPLDGWVHGAALTLIDADGKAVPRRLVHHINLVNFATLPDSAKWILSFGMLLGRLEILTVAVLFFPSFWKQ